MFSFPPNCFRLFRSLLNVVCMSTFVSTPSLSARDSLSIRVTDQRHRQGVQIESLLTDCPLQIMEVLFDLVQLFLDVARNNFTLTFTVWQPGAWSEKRS